MLFIRERVKFSLAAHEVLFTARSERQPDDTWLVREETFSIQCFHHITTFLPITAWLIRPKNAWYFLDSHYKFCFFTVMTSLYARDSWLTIMRHVLFLSVLKFFLDLCLTFLAIKTIFFITRVSVETFHYMAKGYMQNLKTCYIFLYRF